jgi:hypothetical protein
MWRTSLRRGGVWAGTAGSTPQTGAGHGGETAVVAVDHWESERKMTEHGVCCARQALMTTTATEL